MMAQRSSVGDWSLKHPSGFVFIILFALTPIFVAVRVCRLRSALWNLSQGGVRLQSERWS